MVRIQIDGLDYRPAVAPVSWQDLLGQVDRTLDTRGLIVTDVRFDGLDEPAYRDAPVLDRLLDEGAVIEVASATPRQLVNRCLDDAAASLPALAEAASEVGEQFRGVDIGGANASLAELAEGLATLVGIVAAAGGALGLNLRTLPCEGGSVGERVAGLTVHVDAAVTAQQQQDWVTVADVLQYDLAPALAAFVPVLDGFERSSPAA